MSAAVLRDSGRGAMAGGGTVSYTVELDGRWVGWVGDERAWLGHRHGGRRWWACWREDGDSAARWNTGDTVHPSRASALEALIAVVRSGT